MEIRLQCVGKKEQDGYLRIILIPEDKDDTKNLQLYRWRLKKNFDELMMQLAIIIYSLDAGQIIHQRYKDMEGNITLAPEEDYVVGGKLS